MDYQIDLGHTCWRLPADKSYMFASIKRAKQHASHKGISDKGIFKDDTRKTVEVVRRLLESEDRIWDEYFSCFESDGVSVNQGFPEGPIHVFVVTGSNEGLYLHVEVENKVIFLGKTCDSSTDKWFECWLSAARIARLLGA